MIKQAMGVYTKTRIIPETEFNKLSTTAKAYDLPFNTNAISSSQNMTDAETISGRREAKEPIKGNIDVQGTLELPLDTIAFGYLLAATFGSPTTTAVGQDGTYQHVFKANKEQPSFTVEKEYKSDLLSLITGCKVSKLSFSFGGDGELTASADVVGCTEEINNVTKAKSVEAVKLNRLNNFQTSMKLDGKEVAIATEISLDIDFGLDTDGYAIGSNGFRARINEGLIKPSGSVTTFFDDKSLLEKAINNESVSLQLTMTKGKQSLVIDIPEVLLERKTPEITGSKGLTVDLNYNAFYEKAAIGTCIQFTLVNDVAKYDAFKA